jgi:hypothetical protein
MMCFRHQAGKLIAVVQFLVAVVEDGSLLKDSIAEFYREEKH